MREWLYWHFPIITTRWRKNEYATFFVNDAEAAIHKRYDRFIKFKDKSTWAAINPVLHDLESLRADTWNQDKITKIQNWLRDNFEVKDDNT